MSLPAEKRPAACFATKDGKPTRSICPQPRPGLCWPPRKSRSNKSMNIGIDLGTTNSALAFIDSAEDADFPSIRVLDVPQYVAAGRVEAFRTLPSFLYLGDQEYVGVYARDQTALVPTKSDNSAKSWLSNPKLDRTAKILPWDAHTGGRVLSPVEVSTKIIAAIRDAWDKVYPDKQLVQQDVVLTVPASFDEEARELT